MSTNTKCQIQNPKRDEVLSALAQQMRQWDMAIPTTEPLVMDFGLGQFDNQGIIEYWLANQMQAGYCGKFMFLFDGQQCPAHAHRIKHETFYPLHGQFEVVLNDKTTLLNPGSSMAIPVEQIHSFKAIGNSLLLELSMPCDPTDNQFQDPDIMQWLARVFP
ncbi:MAG: cupin domain-containing protein [Phycisphaeraceae bacterium]|nr:cupin domain-containing protein [Phycisphaeraceae bacterium]